jgi:hypothetical protein
MKPGKQKDFALVLRDHMGLNAKEFDDVFSSGKKQLSAKPQLESPFRPLTIWPTGRLIDIKI